jgi:serine/threonine protein kinase
LDRRALADALAHAHERGIIHRDIKPANVLIADDGQPMLLDFNLASDNNEAAAERARVGGTLPYMALEQMNAFAGQGGRIDGRADIYSLGAVLYQLLAQRLPYPDHQGETEAVLERMRADREGPPPMLRAFNPDVSPAVESIIRSAWSKIAIVDILRRQTCETTCSPSRPTCHYEPRVSLPFASGLRNGCAKPRLVSPAARRGMRLPCYSSWRRSPSDCRSTNTFEV